MQAGSQNHKRHRRITASVAFVVLRPILAKSAWLIGADQASR